MGGVLPYKWEAYCSTNGRRIAGFPFLRSLEARKVRRYKWGAYCRTNWRCTAVLFRQVVGVGVSETLPNEGCHFQHPDHIHGELRAGEMGDALVPVSLGTDTVPVLVSAGALSLNQLVQTTLHGHERAKGNE